MTDVLTVFYPFIFLILHPRAFNFLFYYAEKLLTSFLILGLHYAS